MGVDHSISMGYGLLLPPLPPDEELRPDGLEEWLYKNLPEGITHITAGSYYEDDDAEHAIVFSSTEVDANDLSGWLKVPKATITIGQKIQMRQVYGELTGVTDATEQPPMKWHVGGLWH